MRANTIRGFCPRCRHQQTFERARMHHGLHLFLSIITCGLWLISWISMTVGRRLKPWRCQQCGWRTPVFGRPDTSALQSAREPESGASP